MDVYKIAEQLDKDGLYEEADFFDTVLSYISKSQIRCASINPVEVQTLESSNSMQIFGLGKGATQDDLKKAYRKLSLKYHPDLHKGDKNANRAFQIINDKYGELSQLMSKPQSNSSWDEDILNVNRVKSKRISECLDDDDFEDYLYNDMNAQQQQHARLHRQKCNSCNMRLETIENRNERAKRNDRSPIYKAWNFMKDLYRKDNEEDY
jgi:hypothetical protein